MLQFAIFGWSVISLTALEVCFVPFVPLVPLGPSMLCE